MDQLEISSPASLRRMVKVEKGRSNGVAATTKGHFHQKVKKYRFHQKHKKVILTFIKKCEFHIH